MAEELPQEVAASLIDRVTSKQMGEAPKSEKPTAQEAAVEAGSPETEGDKMVADAIMYEIEFGENDVRQLTPTQIRETFKRYRDLNYKNAENANLNKVLDYVYRSGIAKNPDDAARQIVNLVKGMQSNPQMGDTDGQTNVAQKAQESGDPFQQWEEDNAVPLPPGYRENQQMMQQLMMQNQQLQKMLGSVLQQTEATASAGAQAAVEGQNAKSQAIAQRIGNNLDRMAQQLGLTEEMAEDFRMFAGERGYTLDDFLDMGLALKVGTDFKNSTQSGEMDRLREIAKRRQAFTGTIGATPQSEMAQGAGSEEPGDATLQRLAQRARG